jgi:hypothetical protein
MAVWMAVKSELLMVASLEMLTVQVKAETLVEMTE